MSRRRERRISENQNPLIGIQDYVDSENTPRRSGKKKQNAKKNSKVQAKASRKPLGEIQLNTPDKHGSFPEIPVKMNESGCLELEKETNEIAIQTEPCATSIDKMTQTYDETQGKSIDERMITDKVAPGEYWEILAEQRRKALMETLSENKQLYEEIERLQALLDDRDDKCQSELPYFSLFHKTFSGNSAGL